MSSGLPSEELALLVDSVVDYGIVLLDAARVVRAWSAGAARMSGWGADEVVGRAAALLGPPDEAAARRVDALLERARADGRLEVTVAARRRDGSAYDAHLVITAARGPDGATRGYAAVLRDTSGRERRSGDGPLEARTRELAAANEELEAFTYSVSHDLRAPLRAIDGFSEALLEDHSAQLDPPARMYLERIRAAAARMQQLIEDMLRLSRITRGILARAPVDAAAMAREMLVELRARDSGRVVEVAIPAHAVVFADPRFLRIVLQNILENAWKFTRGRSPAHVRLESAVEDGGVRLTVRDDGAGFQRTQAGRLFQPFQRLHRADEFEGTGIGLAIVRRILNRHGGRAWAEGELGLGASVHVWFPDAGPVEVSEG